MNDQKQNHKKAKRRLPVARNPRYSKQFICSSVPHVRFASAGRMCALLLQCTYSPTVGVAHSTLPWCMYAWLLLSAHCQKRTNEINEYLKAAKKKKKKKKKETDVEVRITHLVSCFYWYRLDRVTWIEKHKRSCRWLVEPFSLWDRKSLQRGHKVHKECVFYRPFSGWMLIRNKFVLHIFIYIF